MTIFSDAFKKAGLTEQQNALDVAAAKYFNSGGTVEWFRDWADRVATRMLGEGHDQHVRKDHAVGANAQPPGGDQVPNVREDHSGIVSARLTTPEGQARNVREDQAVAADGLPIASGEGHKGSIRKDYERPAPAAREPSPEYLRAIGISRVEAARSILFRYKTSTGEFWGNVKPYEVGSMARDHIRGVALMTACGPLNPKQMKMTFAQLLSAEQAQIAMEKADKELVNVA